VVSLAPESIKISGVYVRTEQVKKALNKSKLKDLDAALLSLKHSITTNVKHVSASVPSRDLLTEIGMNVLRRAQDVRDSLVKSVFTSKKKSSRKVSIKAAKAAAPKKSSKKATKRKPAAKKKTAKKK
jgi:hypothetical protein